MRVEEALKRAQQVCGFFPCGNNRYRLWYPWREIDGPRTESSATYPYARARSELTRITVWTAMEILGYEAETISWAVPEFSTGRARELLRRAIQDAGPVRQEVEVL